ncbi:Peroxidasin, partial [Eumeta japonica]
MYCGDPQYMMHVHTHTHFSTRWWGSVCINFYIGTLYNFVLDIAQLNETIKAAFVGLLHDHANASAQSALKTRIFLDNTYFYLYLHNNRITSIYPDSFNNTHLRKLRLDSNPIICDCSMLWFVHFLSQRPELAVTATCHGPKSVLGTHLGDMRTNDFNCTSRFRDVLSIFIDNLSLLGTRRAVIRLLLRFPVAASTPPPGNHGQPVIKKEPEDVVVDAGGDVLLSCSATGVPAPEVVWFRDSSALPPNAHRYEVMSNGSLMVHQADDRDDGFFECIAINPMGAVRSRPARMIINKQEAI